MLVKGSHYEEMGSRVGLAILCCGPQFRLRASEMSCLAVISHELLLLYLFILPTTTTTTCDWEFHKAPSHTHERGTTVAQLYSRNQIREVTMQWSRGIGDHEGILSRKEIRLWQMRDEVLRRRDSLGIGEEEKPFIMILGSSGLPLSPLTLLPSWT